MTCRDLFASVELAVVNQSAKLLHAALLVHQEVGLAYDGSDLSLYVVGNVVGGRLELLLPNIAELGQFICLGFDEVSEIGNVVC